MSLSPHDVDAYLGRLGVDAEPPSIPALQRLHAAHVERVPYETFWLHLGERWTIDPAHSARRIAHGDRGGYCFHVNGALAELLRALGYQVTRLVGGVHGPEGPSRDTIGGHLVLVVGDLPTDDHPDGRWYVDAGLGDGPRHAIPLAPGADRQGPTTWTLDTMGGLADWRLTRDPAGSFAGVVFREGAVGVNAFTRRHHFHLTSPESCFARAPTAQRRTATGTEILRGLVLTRTEADATSVETFTRQHDWEAALADVFGLRPAVPRAAMAALWGRVNAGHAGHVAQAA